jgi:hypothetical protein
VGEYIHDRVDDQIFNFYRPRANELKHKLEHNKNIGLLLGIIAVILGALGAMGKTEGYVYLEKLEEGTEFWLCDNCGQVYWKGAHWKKIMDSARILQDDFIQISLNNSRIFPASFSLFSSEVIMVSK